METSEPVNVPSQPQIEKGLNVFERYLSLWVAACMVAGVLAGKSFPALVGKIREWELGTGSQINLPIAVLIWLMIVPMMMKIDVLAIREVGNNPKGLLVTLFVNWMVKPFSMALISWIFLRHVFSPWLSPVDASQYVAGTIILAAAPCTAMVFVWSYLTDGDPAYTLVQVSLDDQIMLVLFAPKRIACLRIDAAVASRLSDRRAGRADWGKQLLRVGGSDIDRAVWSRFRCGAGNRRGRVNRSAGDAFRLLGVQPDAALV